MKISPLFATTDQKSRYFNDYRNSGKPYKSNEKVPSMWRHDMETLSTLLSCDEGSPIGFSHKGPVMRSFYVFLVASLIKGIDKQLS